MTGNSGLELFDDARDVEVRTPSLARVLLTLAGAGVLAAIVVIIIASVVTADRPSADTLCGGESSCSDLTVTQVGALTALAIPSDAEVVSSRYESSEQQVLVEATVRLTAGSPNPFDGSSYFVVDASPLDLPPGSEPFGYYAATGELGALQADGALVTDDGSDLVIVRVLRTL